MFYRLNESTNRIVKIHKGDILLCHDVEIKNLTTEDTEILNGQRMYVALNNTTLVDFDTFTSILSNKEQMLEIATFNHTAKDKVRFKQDGSRNYDKYAYNIGVSPNNQNKLSDFSAIVCNQLIDLKPENFDRKAKGKFTPKEVDEFLMYYQLYEQEKEELQQQELDDTNESIKLNEAFNPNYTFRYNAMLVEVIKDFTDMIQGKIFFNNTYADFEFDYIEKYMLLTFDGETYITIDNFETDNPIIKGILPENISQELFDEIVDALEYMLDDYDEYISNSNYELDLN